MKVAQIVFNVIGLVVACSMAIMMLGVCFVSLPTIPIEKRGIWYFFLSFLGLITTFAGGGAITNFARGRLGGWPTAIMVTGFFMSFWLVPMGIWGIVMLRAEQRACRAQLQAGPA